MKSFDMRLCSCWSIDMDGQLKFGFGFCFFTRTFPEHTIHCYRHGRLMANSQACLNFCEYSHTMENGECDAE